MAKHRRKHRKSRKQAKPVRRGHNVREDWNWAQSYGAVIPDSVPDCPVCETDENVNPLPYNNTGIFLCGKCYNDIVVVVEGDFEQAFCLDDLGKVEESYLRNAVGEPEETYDTYAPAELVEDPGAFLVRGS